MVTSYFNALSTMNKPAHGPQRPRLAIDMAWSGVGERFGRGAGDGRGNGDPHKVLSGWRRH